MFNLFLFGFGKVKKIPSNSYSNAWTTIYRPDKLKNHESSFSHLEKVATCIFLQKEKEKEKKCVFTFTSEQIGWSVSLLMG